MVSGLGDPAAITGGGSVTCSLARAEPRSPSNQYIGTTKDSDVNRAGGMDSNNGEHGDSGGPYVDTDGKLICTLSGCAMYSNGEVRDFGPSGSELLQSATATLHDPTRCC